jgi:DNA invertase Pin-like site-specific DNA recombinase
MLEATDTLIVTELSRLGRSTAEVIALVNALVERNIRLIAIKQNLDISRQDMNSKIIITLFSLFSERERDLISLRTREALAAKKAQGRPLGKPKGTLQKSKFDQDVARIKELLGYGLSVRKIAIEGGRVPLADVGEGWRHHVAVGGPYTRRRSRRRGGDPHHLGTTRRPEGKETL